MCTCFFPFKRSNYAPAYDLKFSKKFLKIVKIFSKIMNLTRKRVKTASPETYVEPLRVKFTLSVQYNARCQTFLRNVTYLT